MDKKFYEKFWSGDSEGLGDFAFKWPKLSRFIPRETGKTILDFGCGKGEVIGAMLKLNPDAKYMGVDVSATAIDFAIKKYPTVPFYRIEDGGKIPIADSSVDFVFSSEVVEHIYDTENAFAELKRIVKPGGEILITTPYHGLIKNLAIVIFGFDKHFNPTGPHVRFFSKKTLFGLIEKNGFKISDHGYYGRFYPVPHSIFVLAKKK